MTDSATAPPAFIGGNGLPCNGAIDGPDFDLAEKVQQLLLPRSSPLCTWCCIGVSNRMASGLGGDYFDFIAMPDGCQSLFIGDVTGHGLHASVVMSLIYGFIHRAALGSCAPLDLVRQVNTFLVNFARRSQSIDEFFSSSLFYSVINPQTLAMHYVNAGHQPALVQRRDRIYELHATGPPVGYFDEPAMKTATFHLTAGDRLLLHTDGVTEAASHAGEMFGRERLKELLRVTAGCDYLEFLQKLDGALQAFGLPDPPLDDCSTIVVDLHGPTA